MSSAATESNSDISKTIGLDSKKDRRHRLKRLIFWGLPILVIVIAVIRWQINDNNSKIEYKTQMVKLGSLTVFVIATGNLQPTNQVKVGSELSGIVESVDVDFNDHVKVGEVLAKLDTSILDSQAQQARATLASALAGEKQAQATITQSRDELDRIKAARKMSRGKAVSPQALVAAQAALDRAIAGKASAEASVNQARAALETIDTNLYKSIIRSPINGIVLSRSVDPGQTVAASFQAPVLFTLAQDLTQMELIVDVDEADVARVKSGQKAAFTVDAYPDRDFPAKITQVRFGPKTVDGVVTYETVLNVGNPDLLLRPGMTATAQIIVKKIKRALLVPNTALRFTPPKNALESRTRRSIFTRLFSRRSHPSPNHREAPQAKPDRQRIWELKGGQPFSVYITTGATDGTLTQVISDNIKPGAAFIVDTMSTKE
ncbi:MAG: efflux RND transporter periplasmic adaptor subunit [Deltaproteobacteria bacterium]|nr:efflux RND transporter periplasmic adaptor subunit [Deltaproteobacteria bacterium]